MLGLTVAGIFGGAKDLHPEDFMMGPRLPARWGESQQVQADLVAAKLKAKFGWKPPAQRSVAEQRGLTPPGPRPGAG